MATALGGAIGYHPAPLPQLRGRAVIPWTILLDERLRASTCSGSPTVWIPARSSPSASSMSRPMKRPGRSTDRHMTTLAAMLDEALPLIAAGTAPRIAQDERYASWAAKRTQEDGRIDWSRSADEILRLIRAVGRPLSRCFHDAGWRAARLSGGPSAGGDRNAMRRRRGR